MCNLHPRPRSAGDPSPRPPRPQGCLWQPELGGGPAVAPVAMSRTRIVAPGPWRVELSPCHHAGLALHRTPRIPPAQGRFPSGATTRSVRSGLHMDTQLRVRSPQELCAAKQGGLGPRRGHLTAQPKAVAAPCPQCPVGSMLPAAGWLQPGTTPPCRPPQRDAAKGPSRIPSAPSSAPSDGGGMVSPPHCQGLYRPCSLLAFN